MMSLYFSILQRTTHCEVGGPCSTSDANGHCFEATVPALSPPFDYLCMQWMIRWGKLIIKEVTLRAVFILHCIESAKAIWFIPRINDKCPPAGLQDLHFESICGVIGAHDLKRKVNQPFFKL